MQRIIGLSAVTLFAACSSTHPQGPVTPLPNDPAAAYAALDNDCGVYSVTETPIATDAAIDHPFVSDERADGFGSIHHGSGAQTPGWNPIVHGSTWSALHPAQSTELNLHGDGHLVATCDAVGDAIVSYKSDPRPDGTRAMRTTYLVHHLSDFAMPETLEEAIADFDRPVAVKQMRSELVTVDYESLPTSDDTRSYRQIARHSVPLRITCDRGIELARRWQLYSAESFAHSDQSGRFCRAQGSGEECLVLEPTETLDGCTVVAESVQATTDAGEAVKFSFAGKITRAIVGGDVVYQLRVDKVRAE